MWSQSDGKHGIKHKVKYTSNQFGKTTSEVFLFKICLKNMWYIILILCYRVSQNKPGDVF